MNRSRLLAPTLVAAGLLAAGFSVPAAEPAPPPAAVATDTVAVTHEQNARVPEGAAWTQHYFPSGPDVELHADVLLPEGLAEGERVPVILSTGPYFGHSGEAFYEGPPHTGPSDRFHDLVEGADLFARGYALVMVDTRGFGGSTGCVDFGGPGDQADVRAAVDWASTQPWSTGAVGMYGKSADATTALIGNNLDQDALRAVVAQEPLWDLYRAFHSNGVPRTTVVDVPRSYETIAVTPQLPDDDPRYRANAAWEAANPECLAGYKTGHQNADPATEYWQARDLATLAQGSDTPLLVTQGFLEWNTEAEGMAEYLDHHEGPERGWLGPWDHVRGNDRLDDGRLAMGREGWIDETMAFYDEHLKGIAPPVAHLAFAVQDSTGAWRAQDTWPVVDAAATVALGGGSYVDDGLPADGTANRYVVRSEPVAQATRITGTPRITLTAEGRSNVAVRLYDVAPDGTAVRFDEQVALLRAGELVVDLRSTDWTLAAGHTLAVEIGTVQPETEPFDAAFGEGNAGDDWIDTPSFETVRVTDARLDLALDDPAGDIATEGARAPYLDVYLGKRTTTLPDGPATFTLPPATG